MTNRTFTLILVLLLAIPSILAHGNETFDEARHIIDEQIPCEELSEDQLVTLGDYAMELMHPGDAHIAMDEMMGGEGSESLRAAHLRMGLSYYCDPTTAQNAYGMMGPGMMGDYRTTDGRVPLRTSTTMYWSLLVIGGIAIAGLVGYLVGRR